MHNYHKSFFSQKRAKEFAANLKAQGAEDIEIWGRKDAFGQDEYSVCWNLWN